MTRAAWLVAAVATTLALVAGPAHAATWTAPGDAPLEGTLGQGAGAWRQLPWTVLSTTFLDANPRSVELLPANPGRWPEGSMLVSETVGITGYVRVRSPQGSVIWEYSGPPTDSGVAFAPWQATWLTADGDILIASRHQGRVLAIDYDTKSLTWQYGTESTETVGPNRLFEAFHATRLPNGNTIICESQRDRIVEVRTADYDPTQPDNGFTAASIRIHSFPGTWPRYVQPLAGGNALITSATGGIFEVDEAWNKTWSLSPAVLGRPSSAERLADGSLLIAEEDSAAYPAGRVVRMTSDGSIIWQHGAVSTLGLTDDASLNVPRRAVSGADGSTIIADQRNLRLLEIGYLLDAVGTSRPGDCGLPGVRKRFTALSAEVDMPPGTAARLSYSVDGGPWLQVSGVALPDGTYGKTIAYQVMFSSTRHDLTPRLLGVTIGYEPAPESVASDGTGAGSGTGGSRGSRAPTGQTTGGTMSGGSGYAAGGTLSDPGVLAGPSSVHRGWAMARISTPAVSGGLSGDGGSPAPELGGLLALGTVYAAGILSVPLQRIFGLLLGRLRTAS